MRTNNSALPLLFILLVFLGVGCSHAQNSTASRPGEERGFRLPDIPAALTVPAKRAEYLAGHYWEHFDFRDTTLIPRPEITEQAFSDFIDLLPHVTAEKAEAALTALMDSASADTAMFLHFMELSEKYLYDPNSPFRNEEYYIPVLRCIVASPLLDDLNKLRPQSQLALALRNRPGDIAADFAYTLSNGRCARMHSLQAAYTILFFNNPDCHDCGRVKEYMDASPLIAELLRPANGAPTLMVLAVYPDADLRLWHQAQYPGWMVNSYDAGQVLTNGQVYDLKAIPTLYLLDKDKRVILKDAPIEQIAAWLQTSTNAPYYGK